MIRLDVVVSQSWIDLAHGVRVQVLPHSSVLMALALEDEVMQRLPDAPSERVRAAALTEAMARAAIIDWDGVGDADGAPMPFDPDCIPALMGVSGMGDAFLSGYVAGFFRMDAEKKG